MFGALVATYIMTLVLTELVTNNAAAALSFPIGYSMAVGYGVDPMPFIMAVGMLVDGAIVVTEFAWGLVIFTLTNHYLKQVSIREKKQVR